MCIFTHKLRSTQPSVAKEQMSRKLWPREDIGDSGHLISSGAPYTIANYTGTDRYEVICVNLREDWDFGQMGLINVKE